ncbi:MAG: CCA tRNA nucleotidyltransferase [Polyangiales bacterium]
MFEQIPKGVLAVCARLREKGHRAWIVGGCVRDLLRGAKVADWDVATSAKPEEVQRAFRRVIPTGIQHGTVTVHLHDGDGGGTYEVTTLRGETTYSDGRRPDSVVFVDDIVADLARRDFTINAIALDPLRQEDDAIVDPFDGRGDLKRHVLRAVGDPAQRFGEDGLRVLRAARFVATLEVDLDPATAAAIRPALGTYRKVSAERVRDEWIKAMKAKKPSRAFEIMREHGLLEVSAPELLPQVGCEQNKWHRYDVWGHALACLDASVGDPILRLSALLHDVGKPVTRAFSDKTQDYTFYDHERIGAEMVEPVLARLRFSNEERVRIAHLVRHHLVCYDASWSDAAVRRWVRRIGVERLEDLYALNEADIRGKDVDKAPDLAPLDDLKKRVADILAQGVALTTKDLAVGGRELMQQLGMKPGPKMGMLLERLLEEVIEDPARNTPDQLLARSSEILPTLPETKPQA